MPRDASEGLLGVCESPSVAFFVVWGVPEGPPRGSLGSTWGLDIDIEHRKAPIAPRGGLEGENWGSEGPSEGSSGGSREQKLAPHCSKTHVC